jgi:SnoaL-like domain
MTDMLKRIADRCEIQDVLLCYARGVDRRDWELVRAAFHKDGTDHHGEFKGVRDDFIKWVSERHAQVTTSTHFLGNCLIEFASNDLAVVETNFIAILTLGSEATAHRQMLVDGAQQGGAGTIDVEVLGRYVDRFEKREGNWRIARRHVVFDSTRSRPANDTTINPMWMLGRRDSDDPVYLARAEADLH